MKKSNADPHCVLLHVLQRRRRSSQNRRQNSENRSKQTSPTAWNRLQFEK